MAALGRQSRLPPGRCEAGSDLRGGPPTCSTPRSPASIRGDAILLDRHQSALGGAGAECAASASAGSRGGRADRRDRAAGRSHLQVSSISAPVRRRLTRSGRRQARLRRDAEERQEADDHSRAGCAGALPTALPCWRWRADRRRGVRPGQGRLERLQRAAHAAGRVGGLDLGFVPGEGGRDTGHPRGCGRGEIDVVYLLGADEIDTAGLGKAFVVYQGHHGDARCPSRRRRAAGRRLYREEARDLREHRRPRAGRARVFPPGEAREDWEDPARSVRCAGQRSFPSTRSRQVRARIGDQPDLRHVSTTAAAGRVGSFGNAGCGRQRTPFASPITEFLHDRPDQPRVADHGRLRLETLARQAAE